MSENLSKAREVSQWRVARGAGRCLQKAQCT